MKKTLITLAALAMASVASAVAPNWAASGNEITGHAPTAKPDTTTGAFTLIAVWDWETLTKGIATAYSGTEVLYTGTNAASDYLGMKMWSESETTVIQVSPYAGHNEDGQVHPLTGNSLSESGNQLYLTKELYGIDTGDGITKLAMAMTFTPDPENANEGKLTLYALKNDGTLGYAEKTIAWTPSENAYGEGTHFNTTAWNALTFSTVLSEGELIHYMSASVPEPTTATLSLLALAGLAARRRRK